MSALERTSSITTWADFAAADPDMARWGEERFERSGLVLVGTISKDGYPRISPVEPVIAHSELYLGTMWRSAKALDLLRNPRYLVHNTVANRDGSDGEFMVRGLAVDVQVANERERYRDALFEKINWRLPTDFHLFRMDIEIASSVEFVDGERQTKVWRAS